MNIKELYKLYQSHPVLTTDSRDCPPDSIFLALKGASFNGNQFALTALEKGCAYAIVDEELGTSSEPAANIIKVDDCLQTYKDLAREHRRQFRIPVIAITGTNGKTTTKELVRAVLAEKYRVLATEGNYNNDVGVPKTLFRLSADYDIAVVEMGASHPGDNKTLVETAEPTCGLITNVGRAHLQGFGSFEGVCQTKGELYDYLLGHHCPLFINHDNEFLMRMAVSRQPMSISQNYYYGQSDASDILVRGEIVACDPFLRFRWREQRDGQASNWMEVRTHVIGAYNLDNMLAAITVGCVNGVTPDCINHALANYVPTNNRSQLTVTTHNRLVIDAYNANPTSMAAAIDNFRLMEVPHKMAILGSMRELGDVSDEEHRQIVIQLQQAGFDDVWLVGDEFARVQPPFRTFDSVEDVKTFLQQTMPQDKTILIKGSNSTRLYELPEML